jgi:hypothetical protein
MKIELKVAAEKGPRVVAAELGKAACSSDPVAVLRWCTVEPSLVPSFPQAGKIGYALYG